MIRLRDYQLEALSNIERAGNSNVLVVAPTGAGKGTIATEYIARAAKLKKRVLFMVHRREIVHDIARRLGARGIRLAQTLRSDRLVRVVSVQSVLNSEMLPVDELVVDEAHHYAADEWGKVLDATRAKKIIGFTATPQRADGRALGDIFGRLVDVVSYSELIQAGHLVPCRVLRPRALLSNEIARDPAEAYLEFGRGETCVIFARRVTEAQSIRDQLRAAGVAAECISGLTPKPKRDDIMARFAEGFVSVVVNVGVLTEGVDIPHVSCIVLARPCAHASTYVQIVGRALRAAHGKHEATLIDLVGASHEHGLPAQDRHYSLEGAGIEPERRLYDPRHRSGEAPEDPEVLDLDLELVAAVRPMAKEPPPKIPRPAPSGPRNAWFERGHSPITAGFVYESKGYWNLAWNSHGKRQRIGLATKEREVAEQMLEVFRQHGPEATRSAVRQRKIMEFAIYRDGRGTWRLWYYEDADRTKRARRSLYTEDEAEAQTILELFQRRCDAEAEQRIAANYRQQVHTMPPEHYVELGRLGAAARWGKAAE